MSCNTLPYCNHVFYYQKIVTFVLFKAPLVLGATHESYPKQCIVKPGKNKS